MSSLKQKILLRIYVLTFLIIFAMSAVYYYLYAKDIKLRSQQNVRMGFEQIFDDVTNRVAAVEGKIENFVATSFVNPVYMTQMLQAQQQASGGAVPVTHVKKVMTYLYGLAAKAREFAALTDTLQIEIYGKNGLMLVVSRQVDAELQTVVYLPEVNPNAIVPVQGNDRWYAALQRLEDIPFEPLPPELPVRYPTALPETPTMTFGSVNGLLTITFLRPIADRGNVQGLAKIHLGIRQQDVERYARLSGTSVNVFVGANFSAGTLPSYNSLSMNLPVLRGAPNVETLLAHRLDIAFSDMTAGGHSYYQGTALLGSAENILGAITVHYPRALEEAQRRKFFLAVVSIASIFSLIAVAEAFGLSGAIAKPISRLMLTMKSVENGDLSVKADIRTGDELQRLAESFNVMTTQLQEHIRQRGEQERLRREMELARRIQTAILPTNFRHDGLEIEAMMLTAEEVSGDYYDVLHDKDGTLWLGIGDVSGHGVTPGLIMLMAQTIHTTVATHFHHRPAEVVAAINRVLYHNVRQRLGEDHFMTFTALKYLGEGEFEHAGAHLTMIVYRRASRSLDLIKTDGVFLNFIPDIANVTMNGAFRLEIGDVLVLYTDGLTESFAPDGTMLDLAGFQRIIQAHAEEPLLAMRDGILNDVLDWCHQERKDDMSLLLVRRVH